MENPMECLSTDDLPAVFAAMQAFIDEHAALLNGSDDIGATSIGSSTDPSHGDGSSHKDPLKVLQEPFDISKDGAPKRPKGGSSRPEDFPSLTEPDKAPLAGSVSPSILGAKPTPKPRAKYNYNPNRARDDERKELIGLRDQADDLALELEALEEARRSCAKCRHGRQRSSKRRSKRRSNAAHESVELPRDRSRAAEVWKEIASSQFQQHMHAVRENRRLRRVVEGHREITDSLKRLLEHKAAAEPIKLFDGEPRVWPMMALVPDLSDTAIYAELLDGLDRSYREAEGMFRDSGLAETDVKGDSHTQMHEDERGNLYAQIFAHKIFPFDVSTTGLVCWKHFSFCVRPNCTSFFSQLGAENVEESDDTVAESFGIEFRLKGTTALFRGKQIKRRYVEQDRVVIVWKAFVNPVEFDGRPITGAAFRERGYFIVKRPSNVAPDATFSLLQSCYVLTPNIPVRILPQHSVADALVRFVLNCMAASVPVNHHIIENLLFDAQMEQQMQRGPCCP